MLHVIRSDWPGRYMSWSARRPEEKRRGRGEERRRVEVGEVDHQRHHSSMVKAGRRMGYGVMLWGSAAGPRTPQKLLLARAAST